MATQTVSVAAAEGTAVRAEMRAVGRSRLLYIDNLRLFLVTMVILFHLAITYGAAGDWSYNEEGPQSIISAVLLTVFVGVTQAYFMGLYFMLSSYFAPRSYDRKGAASFAIDRLKRLGIPLLLYFAVLRPLIRYVLSVREGFQGSLGSYLVQHFRTLDSFGDGPLWFVLALLAFSLGYALWRRLLQPRPLPVPEQRTAPGNGAIVLFALALGLVTFLVRTAWPVGQNFEPLHWQLGHFTQYVALFVVGLLAYRRGWFDTLSIAQGRRWGWIALALAPLLLVIFVVGGAFEVGEEPFMGGWHWQSLAYSLWEQFMGLSLIVFLLVWFRTHLNHQGALARALSADAYATYVFFAPLIVLLGLAFSGLRWEMGLKFLLVGPVAVALCFLAGHYVRKLPVARDIL
jgi:glucan biosynthesis protein C